MFDVVSVGSATLDVFIKSPDLRLLKTREVFTGEAIMVPYGAKCEVEQLVVASGGGGTNTAVSFTRLGLKSSVLARCGWDFAGRLVRRELKKEKVDDSLLIQLEKEETDYSTILIGPDGGQTILVYRGGTRLEESFVNWRRLRARWFCISSLEGNLNLLAKLIEFARKNKIKIAVNPGKREIEQREKLLPLLVNVDLLVINQQEAAKLVKKEYFNPELFEKTALVTDGLVVVTRGKQGACLFDREDNLLVSDGFEVEMVDATGAGDGFFSGLTAGLINDWPLEKALKLGAAVGAAVVREIGAKAGLLYQKNVHNWLQRPLKMSWRKKRKKILC